MTIDEAIEVLGLILKDREPYTGSLGNDAIKLGIEALKVIKDMRIAYGFYHLSKLEGEAKE